MRNLMTRKIVFGILMTLVLAFSVQGVAEALSDLSESTLPADLGTQNIASTFNATINATPDRDNTRETVRVTVTNATFLVDGNPKSSYTFQEEDGDGTTPGFQDGSLTVPALTFTVTRAGKVNVTIIGTASADNTAQRIVRTYYAPQATIPASATIRLAGISNGISTGYFSGTQLVYGGGGNYPVTYTITGATAQIEEGTRTATYTSGDQTSTAARISLQNRTTSATVTATVGANVVTGVYVYGFPTLSSTNSEVGVEVATAASDGSATPGQTITDAFTATVRDGTTARAEINGVPVKFEVKDKSVSGGKLLPGDAVIVDSSNRLVTNPQPGKTLYVQTTGTGDAAIDYEVGSAGRRQIVIVSAVGETEEVAAITAADPERVLSVHANVKQTGTTSTYDLIVLLKDDGEERSGVTVTFNTLKGTLTNTPPGGSPTTGTQVTQTTDSQGQAHVIYNAGDSTGVLEVVARVPKTDDANDTETVQLTINVSGGSVTPTPQQPDQPRTNTYALSFNLGTSITGNDGDEITIEARATDPDGFRVPQVPVSFTISDSDTGTLSVSSDDTDSNGVARTILTLGDEDGELTATASGYDTATASITITPAATDLEVFSGSGQTGTPGSTLSSPFVVRFRDDDGDPIVGAQITFAVETGGGSLSNATDTTDSDGEAETTLTLGTAGMRNTVRANVDSTDYPGVASAVFTAEASLGPDAIIIVSGDGQIGQVGRLLDEDLSIQVVDRDDNGISGVLVRFRITEGRGRLSRNSDRTDPDGYAEIGFTPTADGETVVEAYSTGLSSAFFTITTGEPPADIVKISGDTQSGSPGARLANPFVVEVVDENEDPVSGVTVNFAVTAGGGSVSPSSATTNASGRAQTRLTLGDEPGDNRVAARVSGLTAVNFTATSGMQVLVDASERAPMYWISRAEGSLYRLVDADIEALAPNVTGVMSITVDTANNLLYFAVQTGGNRGEIRSANLNGRSIRTLKTLTAVPIGIAVDSAGDTVYWTNSRGRIQSIAAQGSTQLTNVLQNLPSPGPIVVSNGHLYWGETAGRIRRIDLTATRQTIQNIATGLDEPLSLAVAKNKLYWIERGDGGGGSLNRSNLDGSNAQTLKTFASGVPTSLAVDGSDNKIYWTRGTGKIQRANLVGRFVKDIASGVMSPAGIALNVAASANTAGTQQANNQQSNNQQTTYSMYDVNRDGAVNNADTRAVASAIGQSGSAIANARTDVDGSGEVDVTDIILVIANLDDDVAAPAIDIDVKTLDIDFDRVQEQVEVLLASGDRSIAAQRALLYLQHLLASARPDETVLLVNYPNPFNPETWIPYHLAESTEVRVNIYDSQGVLVRALTLGHQTAGYYTSRSRAAYWDGRNALGERVASGIYFYQLETDAEVSPLRKMVILK